MKKIFSILILFFFCINTYSQARFSQKGEASFYANKFNGRKTANGEIFRQNKLTAAHRTLPFGTVLKVTNLSNGKSVIVRINDRGPFARGRIIDLSKLAAKKLDFIQKGHVMVSIQSIGGNYTKKITNKEKRKNRRYKKKHSKKGKYIYKAKPINSKIYKGKKKYYGVQIASYTNLYNAKVFINSARRKTSKQINIAYTVKGRKKYYKVVVGKYKTDKEARKIQKSLKRKFRSCFVLNY